MTRRCGADRRERPEGAQVRRKRKQPRPSPAYNLLPKASNEENAMTRSIAVRRFALITGLLVALAVACPAALRAKEPAPKVSQDGLELKKETKQRLVYVKPGADFSPYKRVAILDCHVEFSKDWVRDYNSSRRDLSGRIDDSDLERAKNDLSAQFKKVFSKELQKNGSYQVTDTAAPDVLVLRPALINIRVSAPDLMTAGRSTTYVQSAGEMTLYLELWDSATNTILARVVDAQADPQSYGQISSSVSNRAAADRLMQRWASELHKALDTVRPIK